jgi:hypothetical protein
VGLPATPLAYLGLISTLSYFFMSVIVSVNPAYRATLKRNQLALIVDP